MLFSHFELLEFHKNKFLSGFISQLKGFPFTCFHESFHLFGEIVFTHFLERPNFILTIANL